MTPRVHLRWTPLGSDAASGAAAASALLPLLSDDERMRHAGTADQAAAARFVIGRAALRVLAAELVTEHALARGGEAVAPAAIEVKAHCTVCGGPHGRPVIDLRSPKGRPLAVSIGHTAAGVVVAAGWRGPIGVDVELADAPIASLAAVSSLIPPAARPAGRNWEPIQHWTRVEAVVKADGRGLAVDPAEVTVETRDGAISAHLTPVPGASDDSGRYALADVRLDPAVRASVAVGLSGAAKKKPVVPLISWRPLPLDELVTRLA